MLPHHAILLFIAAICAGALNSVAGGGGFIAFPALLFTGILPVNANATNTVALWPGTVASTGAYRRELEDRRHWQQILPLIAVSLVGGLAGAKLLLRTPQATFMRMVPWLLLGATILFTFGGYVTRWVRTRAAQHRNEDVAIEHSRDGDPLGGSFKSGDSLYGRNQRFAMMRPGAAQQGAVDIEENQGFHGKSTAAADFSLIRNHQSWQAALDQIDSHVRAS